MNFDSKRVLVFGDSIMYGSGNGGYGVAEYIAHDLKLDVGKYCVGGSRVGYFAGKDWMVQQVKRAIGDRADVVVFDGFTNDCCKTNKVSCDVPLGEEEEGFDGFDIEKAGKEDSFSHCFQCILSALKSYFPNAALVFVRPHRMGRREEHVQILYGERAAALAKKWGAEVVDLYRDSGLDTFLPEHRDMYTNDSYGWGTGDCTHPNAAGYEKFYMPHIEEAIKKLL